jgi:hypothetical protein
MSPKVIYIKAACLQMNKNISRKSNLREKCNIILRKVSKSSFK